MPIFSVLIPLYNKENDITKTLSSVFAQLFTDFEIVIINDGSTDNSEAEVLKFTDPRIRYYKTANRGISQARNLGIEKSQGKLIAFLDADDLWLPNHLEQLYKLYSQFPEAGLMASNYKIVHPNNYIEHTFFKGIDKTYFGIVPNIFKVSLKYRLLWTSAVAVKKEVFNIVGTFDPNINLGAAGEDTDLWIRIALNYPIAFNGAVTAQYMLGAGNRVSHAQTLKRQFAKLDKFRNEEKVNKSLQKFLDLYRATYALRHKMAGDDSIYRYYKNNITTANLPLKTRLLLALPVFILKILYAFKQKLKRSNMHIDIYS